MTNRGAVLHGILRGAKLVLLDFDGPLCDVFANLPASDVARKLEAIAGEEFDTDDPLEVLQEATRRQVGALRAVEAELVAAEVRAVSCSSPITEGVEFIKDCLAHRMKVGIVSNNAADAIRVFLDVHDLSGDVAPVVGRALHQPELMKPNPWPMNKALTAAGVPPPSAAFVGDSLSDIEVARAVSVPCVAYANKPGKRELFEDAGATVVIDSMSELSTALNL